MPSTTDLFPDYRTNNRDDDDVNDDDDNDLLHAVDRLSDSYYDYKVGVGDGNHKASLDTSIKSTASSHTAKSLSSARTVGSSYGGSAAGKSLGSSVYGGASVTTATTSASSAMYD